MHSSLGLSKLRLIFLLIASLAVGGLAGLMAVALCALVMRFGGTEAPDKHGISVQQSVRVGGVLIAIYLALYIGYQYFLLNASTVTSGVLFCTVASISFFMLGLQEDLKGNLSAVVRFILMLALAGAIVWLRPDYRLVSLGVPLLDELLLGSYMATVVFAVLGLVFWQMRLTPPMVQMVLHRVWVCFVRWGWLLFCRPICSSSCAVSR